MKNAVFTIALAVIILPAQYFLGETLSDYMVKDQEYNKLSELMCTYSRLLNDMRSVEVCGFPTQTKCLSMAMKFSFLTKD